MAYDYPPNFASSEPFDAWWYYAAGAPQACATHAAYVLASIRTALGLSAVALWDDALQAALVRTVDGLVAQDPAWASWRAAVVADQAARRVSIASLTVGIYLAYYRPYGRQFDALTVPPTATLPTWGVPVAGPSGGTDGGQPLACWVVGTAPPTGFSPAEIAARALSTTGVQMRPGERPPIDLARAPDVGGIPWWGLALGGVVFAGGVGYLLWRTK